ncbi:MAG: 4Fe-4S dicluster domain-containing protein [Chloroflexi bacterium]|nr:4Fe-4S dicluster domain-containing protein [Chloroflexota bacterium]
MDELVPSAKGRVVDDWRELFPSRPVDAPSYALDLVGPLIAHDERDCLFARHDLRPDSDRYQTYYARHPERQALDDELRSLPGLGGGEGPAVKALGDAIFASALLLGSEESVQGLPPAGGAGQRVQLPPEEAAAKVKGLAHLLGADLIGIGPLNPAFVYTHVGRTFYPEQRWGAPIVLDHPYAINLGIRMNVGGLMRTAPQYPVLLESANAYARGALIAVQVATYLRRLGYSARAHHLRNYQVLSVPVAVDGGLGELARCGFLVTREYGNCLRLATVTTDLPLATDAPVDLGVQHFCERCQVCAKECPAGAIPNGPKVEVHRLRKWALDAERCYRYWLETGSDCALCIVACPWSHWALGSRPEETEAPPAGSHLRPARRPNWLR